MALKKGSGGMLAFAFFRGAMQVKKWNTPQTGEPERLHTKDGDSIKRDELEWRKMGENGEHAKSL